MTTKFRTKDSMFKQVQRRTIKMSQTGCILHRKAGTFPPTELLTAILAANPSGWGAATVSEVDGRKLIQINSDIVGADIVLIQDTLKTFEDQDITFYFCSSEPALAAKDMSPYILVATPTADDPEQEEPQIIAFIEGSFPAYEQVKSSHPAEYHLASDILVPKFEGLYEMVDHDLDKLTLNLMKPHFKKELLLTSVARGTITLLAANGVCLSFTQGEGTVEGPWGWCSNSYGYGEAKKPEPVAEKPAKKGMFASKSTVREKAPSQPAAVIAEAVKAPATSGAVIGNYTTKKWKPQESYTRKERRNAYKMRIGYCPVGWQDGVEVDVWHDNSTNKLMTFSQVKALGPISLGVQQLAKNPPKVSDTDTDHVDGDTAQTGPGNVTAEILPIMSPKTREAVNDIRNKTGYKKIIEENSKVITDPKQFESFETKFADFAAQMGMKSMDEFASWDFEMINSLPDQAAKVMLNTFKNAYLKGRATTAVTEKTEPAPLQKKKGMFAA